MQPDDGKGIAAAALLAVAARCANDYCLTALDPRIAACQAAETGQGVSVAVVGRYNAGKSSFLNHFLGAELLPTGVVPVTTVITELRGGSDERAHVRFLDGHVTSISSADLGRYVGEKENPQNEKQVAAVVAETHGLARWPGLVFIDTPGLESVLPQGSNATSKWLPNVAVALVAVSAEAPLSSHDVDLIRLLQGQTPNVAVLVTKADLLDRSQLAEVLDFVQRQLASNLGVAPSVWPYSVRAGFEHFRGEFEAGFVRPIVANLAQHRQSIARHKVRALLSECREYLLFSLRAADASEAERHSLISFLEQQGELLPEMKGELGLLVTETRNRVRTRVMGVLEPHETEVRERLLSDFQIRFSGWQGSLARTLEQFELWIAESLSREMTRLSEAERNSLIAPCHHVKEKLSRRLREIRERINNRSRQALAFELPTGLVEFEFTEPQYPDISPGKIFDHSWELLSPICPMSLLRQVIRRHFAARIAYSVEVNLSRLATQWAEALARGLEGLSADAEAQLDDWLATLARLIENADDDRGANLRCDLAEIENALAQTA